MRWSAVAIVVAGSCGACSRIPEEPTPVHRDPVTAAAAKTTDSFAEPAVHCPDDPDPSANTKLYEHGTATFVTPDEKRHDFKVEIARTEEAQARGLMFRTSLADDAGMVFVFDQPHHATFWMRNTCIALDMVFVSEDKRVIGVVTAPPLSDNHREVNGFSKFVVELKAGTAAKHGIAIGTSMVF